MHSAQVKFHLTKLNKLTVGKVGEGSGGPTDDRGVASASPPSCCGDVRGGSAQIETL